MSMYESYPDSSAAHHERALHPPSDSLYRLSDDLEALVDSQAFEQLMLDNKTTATIAMQADSITIPRSLSFGVDLSLVPEDILDMHGMPHTLALSDIDVDLVHYAEVDQWLYTMNYAANDVPYRLIANEDMSIVTMHPEEDSHVEAQTTPDYALRFLASIALAARHELQIPPDAEHLGNLTSGVNFDTLRTLMQHIGSLKGSYQSELSSSITMLEADRALELKLVHEETLSASRVWAGYRLAYAFGGRLMESISSQTKEVDSVDVSQSTTTSFDLRRPGHLDPAEIAFDIAAQAEQDEQTVLFTPATHPLGYTTVNASIMGTLQPLLARYGHLDTLELYEQ